MSETEGENFAYDEVIYPTPVMSAQTPDQIGAAAALHGWTPPDAENARVLEVGCGNGFNIIAVAANWPGTRCVGFDLSANAIKTGQALIEAAGLKNVELHVGDITTWPRDGEKFDYISCHGVYTWIPQHVRQPLLDLYGALLAPGGLAYLSYDCLPASGPKYAINRFLIDHVKPVPSLTEHVDAAVELIFMLARHQRPESRLKPQLDHLVRDITSYPMGYFYHDWLAPFYAPTSLEELAEAAGRAGLELAGDTALHDLFEGNLDDAARAVLATAGNNHLKRSQIMDMLIGSHMFRADLLVRTDAPPAVLSEPLRRLSYCFLGTCTEVDFEGSRAKRYAKGDSVYLTAPAADAERILTTLLAVTPAELSYADLLRSTGVEQEKFDYHLHYFTYMGLLESHITPQNFVLTPGERPRSGRLVRTMLAADDSTITLRHLKFQATESPTRLMVSLSDGTRTRAEIAAAMSKVFGETIATEKVDGAMAKCATKGLFEA